MVDGVHSRINIPNKVVNVVLLSCTSKNCHHHTVPNITVAELKSFITAFPAVIFHNIKDNLNDGLFVLTERALTSNEVYKTIKTGQVSTAS